MIDAKSLFVGAIPGLALTIIMVTTLPALAPVGTQVTLDSVGLQGYVTVTVTRDGDEIYHHDDHNIITTAGKDFISAQIGSTSPGTNGANFIGLSSDTTAPAAGDTTLTGEITSGGLERTQGTYGHTNGEATLTVASTFTASATHNDVQKAGLFTATSGGTMMAGNTFTPVTLNSGDQLTITWTITLS